MLKVVFHTESSYVIWNTPLASVGGQQAVVFSYSLASCCCSRRLISFEERVVQMHIFQNVISFSSNCSTWKKLQMLSEQADQSQLSQSGRVQGSFKLLSSWVLRKAMPILPVFGAEVKIRLNRAALIHRPVTCLQYRLSTTWSLSPLSSNFRGVKRFHDRLSEDLLLSAARLNNMQSEPLKPRREQPLLTAVYIRRFLWHDGTNYLQI